MKQGLKGKFKREQTRKPLRIIALIVVIIVLIWVRAFYGSVENYRKGEKFLKEDQTVRAITFFDRSLHWYTPFNPYVEKSAERLWEIGNRAMQRKDTRLALIAFRTIRSGFYAASHFVIPGKGWIEKSESKINDLLALEDSQKGLGQQEKVPTPSNTEERKSPYPSIFWSVVVELGFFGWVGSVIGFIVFRFRPGIKPAYSPRQVLAWGGLAFVFFGLWILGMCMA